MGGGVKDRAVLAREKQRILAELKRLKGARDSNIPNYEAEAKSLDKLFKSVPQSVAGEVHDWLDLVGAGNNPTGSILLVDFTSYRPRARKTLRGIVGRSEPGRLPFDPRTGPNPKVAKGVHSKFREALLTLGLHHEDVPLTVQEKAKLFNTVRAMADIGAFGFAKALRDESTQNPVAKFVRATFKNDVPKILEILDDKVRRIESNVGPGLLPNKTLGRRLGESSNRVKVEPPKSRRQSVKERRVAPKDLRKGLGRKEEILAGIVSGLREFEPHFQAALADVAEIQAHELRKPLDRFPTAPRDFKTFKGTKTGQTMNSHRLVEELDRFKLAHAELAAGIALNVIKLHKPIQKHALRQVEKLSWVEKLHGEQGIGKLRAEFDEAWKKSLVPPGPPGDISYAYRSFTRPPAPRPKGPKHADKVRKVLKTFGFPYADTMSNARAHQLLLQKSAESLQALLKSELNALAKSQNELINALDNPQFVFELKKFTGNVLVWTNLDKTEFGPIIRAAEKPASPLELAFIVIGTAVGLASQNWAFLALSLGISVGEIALVDLVDYDAMQAAYRLHMTDTPPDAIWLLLAGVGVVSELGDFAKFIAKATKGFRKLEMGEEQIAHLIRELDPSMPGAEEMRHALEQAAEADRVFRQQIGEMRDKTYGKGFVMLGPAHPRDLQRLFLEARRRDPGTFEETLQALHLKSAFDALDKEGKAEWKELWSEALGAIDAANNLDRRMIRKSRMLSKRWLEGAGVPDNVMAKYKERYTELVKSRAIASRRAKAAKYLPGQIKYKLTDIQRDRIKELRRKAYGPTMMKGTFKDANDWFREKITLEILDTPGHPYEIWINRVSEKDYGRLTSVEKWPNDFDISEVVTIDAGHMIPKSEGGKMLAVEDSVLNRKAGATRKDQLPSILVRGIPTELDTAILFHNLGIISNQQLSDALKGGFKPAWLPPKKL